MIRTHIFTCKLQINLIRHMILFAPFLYDNQPLWRLPNLSAFTQAGLGKARCEPDTHLKQRYILLTAL